MPKNTIQNKSGFTLIELLIVISIVSILAAILFPVFARARENARRSSCMSNLKQIGLGIMQYVQDYDGHYPSTTRFLSGNSGTSTQWFYDIEPYIKDFRLFVCPSSSQGYGPESNSYTWDQYEHGYVKAGNYGANRLVMRATNSPATYPYLSQASIVSASTTYMILDYGNFDARADFAVAPAGTVHYLPGAGALGVEETTLYARFKDDFMNGRHFGGVNIAFADGHVKWLKTQIVHVEATKAKDLITAAITSSKYQNPSAWNPWADN